MSRWLSAASVLGLLVAGATGCGESGPQLVDAGGTVTYHGKPVAGATVTFVPSAGPTATGKTDAEGEFTLSTGERAGVVVGNAKVSITAFPPPDPNAGNELSELLKDPQRKDELMRKTLSMQVGAGVDDGGKATRSKSLIPIKYGAISSSGLTAAVTDDPDKNQFSFKLE